MYLKAGHIIFFLFLTVSCVSAQEKSPVKDTVNACQYNGTADYLDTAVVNNDISFLLKESFINNYQLAYLEVVQGNIYVSTKGVVRLFTIKNDGNKEALRSAYYQCQPGSKISFEYCIFRNSDGTKTKRISKLFTVK